MARRHVLNKVFCGAGILKMCSFTEAKCFFRSQILLAEKEVPSFSKRKFSSGKIEKSIKVNRIDLCKNVKIPVVGFGTWQSTEEELELAVDTALEAGYRHIDTAIVYGNEKVIGKVLQRWMSSNKIKREDLFIVTKVPPSGNRPEGVKKFLKKSLENLQLDYVDLYLVHVPFGFNDIEGNFRPITPEGTIDMDSTTDLVAVWKTMEEQLKAGLTRSIGVSNFKVSQIQRILGDCSVRPHNLQIELHAYFQQKELVDFCKEHDITVTAYSPLGAPGLGKLIPHLDLPDILGNPTVKALAKKHGKTEAQILLRHIIQKGVIAIPKSTTPARIRQNIDIFDFELDDGDVKKMESLDQGPVARILNFKDMFPGIENHPEFPM